MAARGPPPSLSIPTYPQGGVGSDSHRGRGRNRSGGSSGASSRDHSVEGRGDINARRGGVTRGGGRDFRASYHAQYQDARRVPDGYWHETKGRIGSGPSSQSWSHGGGGNNLNQGGGNDNKLNQGGGNSSSNWGEGGSSSRSNWSHLGDNGNNWGQGGGGNNGNNWGAGGRNNWRSNRGDLVQMRVQAVIPDDARASGLASSSNARSYSLSIGSQSSYDTNPRQRQGNEYERQRNNSQGGYERQENLRYGGQERQRNNNMHAVLERQDSLGHERQEIVGYGGLAGDESRRGDGGRGYGRAGRGRSPFTAGRFAPKLTVPKDEVFGESRELQAFGSPRSFNRKALVSPRESEVNRQWESNQNDSRNTGDLARGGSFKSRDGDLRRGFANGAGGDGRSRSGHRDTQIQSRRSDRFDVNQQQEDQETQPVMANYGSRQLQRQNSHSQPQTVVLGSQREKIPPKKRNDESVSFQLPSPGASKRSHGRNKSFERDVSEKKREEPGELFGSPSSSQGNVDPDFILGKKIEELEELVALSPSSSKGSSIMSERNSLDRRKREEELPVFTPPRMIEMNRQNSIGRKMSRQSSFSSEVFKSLEDGESRSSGAKLMQMPSESVESASAGMHKTRSTDWYEICLKEEEEEQQLLATAKRLEQEDSQRLTLASGEVNDNFDGRGRAKVQDRLAVRGDDAQRNADPRGRDGSLFTPWNSLPSSGSNVLNVGSAARPKSLFQTLEKTYGESTANDGSKHENLRVCISGGRGGSGRKVTNDVDNEDTERRRPEGSRETGLQSRAGKKVINAVDTEVLKKLKPERRPGTVREKSITGGQGGTARELFSDTEHTQNFIQEKKPESLQNESIADRSGGASESKDLGSCPTQSEISSRQQKVNFTKLRPGALYRALMDGEDEPLPHIVGTCPDMCPVRERLQRERLRDLAVFERVSGDMRKTSKELAVKKFCRTVVASELEQLDVRPLPVLWRTLQYLLGLLDDDEFSFDIVHNFLFDRTRAIRQELGMQRILNHQSITMHEEIVRFHISSQHELYELNRKRSKQFDTHLNLQQLSKSLYSLLNLYISLGGDGVHFENEAEFHGYYILLNLGSHGQFQAEPLSVWFPSVPSHVLKAAPMQFARKALRCYRSDNYVGFFQLVREATYLESCLLELNFDSIRATALAILNIAEYKLHPFPFVDLAKMLILEENEVEELCMYYGLLTGIDSSSEKRCLLVKQAQLVTPEKGNVVHYSCRLINSKRAPSFFLEVKGGASRVN